MGPKYGELDIRRLHKYKLANCLVCTTNITRFLNTNNITGMADDLTSFVSSHLECSDAPMVMKYLPYGSLEDVRASALSVIMPSIATGHAIPCTTCDREQVCAGLVTIIRHGYW